MWDVHDGKFAKGELRGGNVTRSVRIGRGRIDPWGVNPSVADQSPKAGMDARQSELAFEAE
jgi:hypothetical protein